MRLPAAVRSLPAPVVALGVLIKAGFVTVSARAAPGHLQQPVIDLCTDIAAGP